MVYGRDVMMSETKIERVEDMPVFQGFYGLALDVEKETKGFDRDFWWLRNQLLRASESVCSNMTEGFYSQYSTEYLQSLYRCRREGRETMTHLKYAKDVGILTETAVKEMLERYEEALYELSKLIGSI
jgi:four helix bundle protein